VELAEDLYEKHGQKVSIYIICPNEINVYVNEFEIPSDADFTIRLARVHQDMCKTILDGIKEKMKKEKITEEDLYVLSRLQYWAAQAQMDEDKLLKKLKTSTDKESGNIRKKQENDLKRAMKRKTELDGLFARLYEDYVSEKITEYNFNMLSEKYQIEQAELEEKIKTLGVILNTARKNESNAEKWLDLIKQYSDISELTAPLLNALIEKIVVHQAVRKDDGTIEQEVEIYYRFIGKIE
jgi:hypothetical protein